MLQASVVKNSGREETPRKPMLQNHAWTIFEVSGGRLVVGGLVGSLVQPEAQRVIGHDPNERCRSTQASAIHD